jgi:hypothetical protein
MRASLKVFVCSTYSDLTEEREAVMNAIRRLQHQHDSMEYFGARPDLPIQTCLKAVRRSDILVVIVGHRYGSMVPETEVSFTEAEYTEGFRLGKPCLVYIRDEEVPILPKYIEKDPNKDLLLNKFKETLTARHTVAFFRNSHDLSSSVTADLSDVAQELETVALVSVEQHLRLLGQGIDVWNSWRMSNPEAVPNLSGANLTGFDLTSADLHQANLSGANLSGATLLRANLHGADLRGANLSRSDLRDANLSRAKLSRANVNQALIGLTVFADIDLREVEGLESVKHFAPSEISINTIDLSEGKIPDLFLRGCGFNDWQIESTKLYQHDLNNEDITDILYTIHDLRAHRAVQTSPLFICYSHADSLFVDVIGKYLTGKGIRFWRDVHHAAAGRLNRQIQTAIRLNPIVLLILSEHSVQSDWVEHETRLALRLERETQRDVLCPIALDDSWKSCNWPERLREQIMEYNILDFSDWKDEDNFRLMFNRLLNGLDLFYK